MRVRSLKSPRRPGGIGAGLLHGGDREGAGCPQEDSPSAVEHSHVELIVGGQQPAVEIQVDLAGHRGFAGNVVNGLEGIHQAALAQHVAPDHDPIEEEAAV